MGQYERPDVTRRCASAVPGATADNGDFPCIGQTLLISGEIYLVIFLKENMIGWDWSDLP